MTPAGYSGTPLPKKLGIAEAAAVAFVRAPDGFAATLGALPDGVRVRARARGPLDVIVFFTTRRADLARRIERLKAALPLGLVDNKVAAIDETWSGLQLVIRRELR